MLTKARFEQVSSILGKKGYLSQTSCGICGREILDDLGKILQAGKRNRRDLLCQCDGRRLRT